MNVRTKIARLKAKANDLNKQARELAQAEAEREFAASPYEIGMVVEGWTWVGLVHPKWKRGTIILGPWVDGGDGRTCVTLEFDSGRDRRAGYFLSSLRQI